MNSHKLINNYYKLPLIASIFLSLIVFNLCNLYSSDDIQLPDIVILGEADKLPDTVSLDKLLQQYWTLSDLSDMKYRPFISFQPLLKYQEPITDNNGMISLQLGSKYYADFRATYLSGYNPLHKYSAQLKTEKDITERQFLTGELNWKPELTANTEYNLKSRLHLNYNSFIDERGLANEIQHFGFGISVSFEEEYAFFEKSSASLSINSYKQLLPAEEKFNDFDMEIGTTVVYPNIAKFPFSLSFIRQKPSLLSGVVKNNFFVFDDIGLIIIGDEENILPSLLLNYNQSFTDFMSLHISNKPSIERQFRWSLIQENPDIMVDFENLPTKTPVNFSVKLNNSRYLPLALSYNLKWHKDYKYYSQNNGLFEMIDDSLLQQDIGIDISYHFHNLMAQAGTQHNITDDFVPFIPYWKNYLIVGWYEDSFRLWTELQYLTDRKDLNETKIDDIILLDIHFQKEIINNLTLNISFNNILDNAYRKYQFDDNLPIHTGQIPVSRFRMHSGITWTF